MISCHFKFPSTSTPSPVIAFSQPSCQPRQQLHNYSVIMHFWQDKWQEAFVFILNSIYQNDLIIAWALRWRMGLPEEAPGVCYLVFHVLLHLIHLHTQYIHQWWQLISNLHLMHFKIKQRQTFLENVAQVQPSASLLSHMQTWKCVKRYQD